MNGKITYNIGVIATSTYTTIRLIYCLKQLKEE
jgi:hypothetical protein